MSTGTVILLFGGAAGLALAGLGIRMLATGQALGRTANSFRSVKEAGAYHLLFGAALILVVIGTTVAGGVPHAVISLFALILVGIAIFRFRPRGRRHTNR